MRHRRAHGAQQRGALLAVLRPFERVAARRIREPQLVKREPARVGQHQPGCHAVAARDHVVDATAQRTLSRRAAPVGFANWAARIQASYPRKARRTELSGPVRIRLIVGPDGKPSACKVQTEISHPSLEAAACAVAIKHARFEPALDAEGTPIASYYGMTLVFDGAP